MSSDRATNDKNKVIKKNYVYNLIYQLLLIIVPLVVTPYVSRKLGAESLGKYSFSYSLITYFTIFAALGFGTYAQREIAKNQGDRYKQSKSFWEIIICRSLSVGIALCVNLVLCLLNLYGDYSIYMLIMSINILAISFDIAFFFQGNEQFGKIVIFNSVIRILGTLSIFIFVKSPDDLWKYTLINSLIILCGYLVLWTNVNKLLAKVNIKELKPLKHLQGTLLLFLPTIAVSIYTVLDRTLIGVLIKDTYKVVENGIVVVKKYSDLENGYYEQSEKIVKMALTVITCIGTVMIPRNTKEYADGNIDKVKENVYTSATFVWLLGIPITLGLMLISSNFVPWFYGDGYDKCITLISIFSPLTLIIGFSNIFGLQYMIPTGKDAKYTIALLCGAFTNLILNIIFIRLWWSIGAAIASIVAEFAVTLVMAFMLRKEINLLKILKLCWRYLIAGIVMFLVIFIIKEFFSNSFLYTVLLIMIGICIYFITLIIEHDPVTLKYLKLYLKKINNKLKRGEN